MDVEIAALIGTAAFAYAVGSIPFAYLVARLVKGVDIRSEGEGNVGARNTFHVVGKQWGAAVLVADIGKGIVVALPFRDSPALQMVVAAVFVVAGHAYPVWLGFVGGKGVAAAGGFGMGMMPLAGGIGAAVGLIGLATTRRFMPSLVPAIVVMFVVAPIIGASWQAIAATLAAFVATAAKRAIDEPRMRAIEAETGWDRVRGGTT